MVLITGLFVAVETFALTSGRLAAGVHETLGRPAALLLVGGLVVCSIFVHEMGHASGCRYGGATPGEMGVGIYVTSPAFFTDLSDGYRLGRWGRIRGDLGGVYFNAVYAVALFPFYLATRSPLLFLVMTAMILEILYQMVPFVRSDGYWAVSDLAGVPDLSRLGSAFRRGQESGLSPSSRRLVRVWGLVTMIVLPTMLLFALLALPALAVSSWKAVLGHVRAISHSGGSSAAAATNVLGIAFASILLGIMIYGIVYITLRLVRMATSDTSGPGHVTKRARRTRCFARAWLVLGAVSFPWPGPPRTFAFTDKEQTQSNGGQHHEAPHAQGRTGRSGRHRIGGGNRCRDRRCDARLRRCARRFVSLPSQHPLGQHGGCPGFRPQPLGQRRLCRICPRLPGVHCHGGQPRG